MEISFLKMFAGTGTCILLQSRALSLRLAVGTVDSEISYGAETDLFLSFCENLKV